MLLVTQFWREVKPLLSDKVESSEITTLVEGEEIIKEDEEYAEILNTYFLNAVRKQTPLLIILLIQYLRRF